MTVEEVEVKKEQITMENDLLQDEIEKLKTIMEDLQGDVAAKKREMEWARCAWTMQNKIIDRIGYDYNKMYQTTAMILDEELNYTKFNKTEEAYENIIINLNRLIFQVGNEIEEKKKTIYRNEYLMDCLKAE